MAHQMEAQDVSNEKTKSYALGHPPMTGMASPLYQDDAKMHYPMCSLSSKEFPPVKEWTVGKTYSITVSAKLTGQREEDDHLCGTFELLSAKEA